MGVYTFTLHGAQRIIRANSKGKAKAVALAIFGPQIRKAAKAAYANWQAPSLTGAHAYDQWANAKPQRAENNANRNRTNFDKAHRISRLTVTEYHGSFPAA
jgi:hypothetical protein